MITDFVITKLEEFLDNRDLESHIVPESNAYPTSGELFISIVGSDNDIVMTEDSIQISVHVTTRCSIRTGKWAEQRKGTPYLKLVNLQEQVFFAIMGSSGILTSRPDIIINGEPLNYTVHGRFHTGKMRTKPVPVKPDFWFSQDQVREGDPRRGIPNNDSRRERGYLLEQTYRTPIISVPYDCANALSPIFGNENDS